MSASKECIKRYLQTERVNDELMGDSGGERGRFYYVVNVLSDHPPRARGLRNTPNTTLLPFGISLDDLQ